MNTTIRDSTNTTTTLRKKRSRMNNSEILEWIEQRSTQIQNRPKIQWGKEESRIFECIYQFFEPLPLNAISTIMNCDESTIRRIRKQPKVKNSDLKKVVVKQIAATAPIRTRSGHFGDPTVLVQNGTIVENPFKNQKHGNASLTDEGLKCLEAFVYGMCGTLNLQHSAFSKFLVDNAGLLAPGVQDLSYSSFCRILKNRGFTSKVPEKRFPRQGHMGKYIEVLKHYQAIPDDLIFVDEKSWDARKSCNLSKVTSPKGSQLPGIVPTRMPTFHTIGAVSGSSGLFAWDSYPIGEVIIDQFLINRIIPEAETYKAKTGRTGILILDACGQHLSENYPFIEEFNNASIPVVYLPTSSPFLSAIEIFWNGLQKVVQKEWLTTFLSLESSQSGCISSNQLGKLYEEIVRKHMDKHILTNDDSKYVHKLYKIDPTSGISSVFTGISDQVGGTRAAKIISAILYGD